MFFAYEIMIFIDTYIHTHIDYVGQTVVAGQTTDNIAQARPNNTVTVLKLGGLVCYCTTLSVEEQCCDC